MQHLSLNRILFGLAIFVYAVFGSPTPDDFGIAEIVILVLLFASLRPNFSSEECSGWILAGYGLSLPVLMALVAGYPVNEVIRDVVPFLFLLMPILYWYQADTDKTFINYAVIATGIIFSVRSLVSFGANIWDPQEWLGTPPDFLYLANSPEVLFTAVALICSAWTHKIISVKFLYLGLSLLPMLAMATLMQRASLFYMLLTVSFLFVSLLWRKPKAAMGAALILMLLAMACFPFIDEIFRQLSFKTQMVGLNSRAAEWHAVFNQLSNSSINFLFGIGWGSEFENPAVGNLRVSFTHSLLSSLFLKTGLIGVIIFLIYGATLIKRALPRLVIETNYLYALTGPLLIGLFLYASYKSLGYGLLLLLLASAGNRKRLDKKLSAVS